MQRSDWCIELCADFQYMAVKSRKLLPRVILSLFVMVGCIGCGDRRSAAELPNEVPLPTSYDHFRIREVPAVIKLTDEQRRYIGDIFSAIKQVIEGGASLESEEEQLLGGGDFFWPKNPDQPVRTSRSYAPTNFRMPGINLRFERSRQDEPWTKVQMAVRPRNFPVGVFDMRLPADFFADFVLKRIVIEHRQDERLDDPIVFYFAHKKRFDISLQIEARKDMAAIGDPYPSSFHALQIINSRKR